MIFKLCDDHYSVNFLYLFTFNFRFDGAYSLSQNWGDEASPWPSWYTQWELVTRITHKRNEETNKKRRKKRFSELFSYTLFLTYLKYSVLWKILSSAIKSKHQYSKVSAVRIYVQSMRTVPLFNTCSLK